MSLNLGSFQIHFYDLILSKPYFYLDPGGFNSGYTDADARGISSHETDSSTIQPYPTIVTQNTATHKSDKNTSCSESNKFKELSDPRHDPGSAARPIPPPPLVHVNDYTTPKGHPMEMSSATHNS